MANKIVEAIVCSPASHVYGVNVYRVGETGNGHMQIYIPCVGYEHAQQVAEAINNPVK